MLKKVVEAVKGFDMPTNDKHITVALSGGADSMALLEVLLTLKEELNIKKISAAHFNHQIRGAEALRDQNFVEDYCKQRNVDCFVGSADVLGYAKQNGLSTELAARKLRYAFFDSLDTDLIATAHTASDNIETVLFNLTRGTALSGLCGIPPVRDRYIRPIILCTREDIENYCKQKSIAFVTDSTNLCDDYTRNKIRHNVVPILKDVNSSAENAVSRMGASLREDENFIGGIARQKYGELLRENGLAIDGFEALHSAVAKRIIAYFCNDSGLEIDSFHINAVYDICLRGGKMSLPLNKSAVICDGVLMIVDNNVQPKNIEFLVDVIKTDNDLFKKDEKVHNLFLKNILDYDKIVGELVLRKRQSGDSIRLKNKNGTKTLKKLFCEYKIPHNERENLPVLCDESGIVWVYKIGVAERCAADENSTSIYKINVKKL
ncbi:MAG: tRNA lysidine(34) synthetase TilS [Ruminococcaceae bacterium]|nr:tRNA lysidine(34) synthetase TilS [Oscillospiraceae bacterium]